MWLVVTILYSRGLPLGHVTCEGAQGLAFRRSLHFIYCLAVANLKFLITLSLKFCFVSEVQMDSGACMWVEKMCVVARLPSLLPRSHVAFTTSHEHRTLWIHSVWGSSETQNKYKASVLSPWLIHQGRGGSWEQLEKPHCSWEPDSALTAERRRWYSNEHQHQKTLS